MFKKSIDKIYTNNGNTGVLDLVTSPFSNILDIGCGTGSLAKILTSRGHIVDGITISPEEHDEIKDYVNAIFIYNLENGLPPVVLSLQYDYVICSHVLEHIVYPEKLLRDIHKVLKTSGFLLVALPNIMHYKSRFKLMTGKFEYQDAGIWDNTHVKWYTFETAKKLLLESNFSIEIATVTGQVPFNSLFSKAFGLAIRRKIFNSLIKISKGLFGYQLLLKAKKA